MRLSEIEANPLSRAIDANTRAIAAAHHMSIKALNASYDLLWGQSDADLAAFLNSFGPARVIEIFQAHNVQATGLNALLDACVAERPSLQLQFPARAIAIPGRVIDWGEGVPEGQFAALQLQAGTFVVIDPPAPPEE